MTDNNLPVGLELAYGEPFHLPLCTYRRLEHIFLSLSQGGLNIIFEGKNQLVTGIQIAFNLMTTTVGMFWIYISSPNMDNHFLLQSHSLTHSLPQYG